MTTNEIPISVSENTARISLRVSDSSVNRSVSDDSGSPYYVGARAYVTQTANGAVVTVIDKDGTTTATILNGQDGLVGRDGTDGEDGVGITSITQNLDGTLTINLDDGTSYDTEPLKGEDGYTPVKGVDYFDGEDGQDGYTPVKGVDYFDGEDGQDGYTPVKGVDYFDGAKGDTGDTGNGIISTTLNADYTLTILFSDGTSVTTTSIRGAQGETGATGNGIANIAKTSTSGLIDTYTITYTNGATDTFQVKNGENGSGSVADVWVDGASVLDGDTAKIDLSGKADTGDIPTAVSELANDAGYITDYTETDPTVPAWAKASSKPTYTASEVGALNGNSGGVFYGTCSTAAGTVAKVVECDAFTADNLKAGTIIIVTFTATNSGAVANLTLNVNGTGAKPIKYINNGTLGNLTSAGYIKAGTEYPFYYDGANWVVWMNYNTTYSALSEADMKAGTATVGRLITAARLKEAVKYHAPVTSVNGNTGAVTINVPTATSELTNDSGFINNIDVDESIKHVKVYATDATSQAILSAAFSTTSEIIVPSDITNLAVLMYIYIDPRVWFAWTNGSELEIARMAVSLNTSTQALTLYLRGRTSIATGIMGVDSSWTVTPLASDAEGVAY